MDFQGKNRDTGKVRGPDKLVRVPAFIKNNGRGELGNSALDTATERCSHGRAFDASCKYCLCESITTQPQVWETIASLMHQSKYARDTQLAPATTISGNGSANGSARYSIVSVESGNDASISEVQVLLRSVFKPEEVEREDVMRSAIEGRSPWGTPDTTRYRMLVAKDGNGKVLSVFTYAHLELPDSQGTRTPRSFLYGGYAATQAGLRQSGLARELYISALMQAAAEANAQGKRLLFAMGECKRSAEKFWNGVGRKRIYVRTNDNSAPSRFFEEIPYFQPPLNFSAATGQITEGAGVVPEHLTIHKFSAEAPTKEEVIAGVRAIYGYNNWPREAFDNDEAFQKHLELTSSLVAYLERFLMAKGNVVLLSMTERECAQAEGHTVVSHVVADSRI